MVQASGASLREQIEADIQEHKVLVYSKSYCPFAAATKDLLKKECAKLGVQPHIIELDKIANGDKI